MPGAERGGNDKDSRMAASGLRLLAAGCWLGDGPAPWPAWVPSAQRRRLDPLARAACAAVEAAGLAVPGEDCALVLSTAYGCVDSTLRFAGSVADWGDTAASPAAFTASVHSHPTGVLGELLGLHGPSATLCCGSEGSLDGLRQASLWLAAGRARRVLLVWADMQVPWTAEVIETQAPPPQPLGQGAAALLVEAGPGPGRVLLPEDRPAPHHLDAHAAAARLGRWFPHCLWHAAPWQGAGACRLAAGAARWWLGPAQSPA